MSAKGRLEAFPPGITVEGATPENEGRKGGQRPGHLSTRSWRTSGQKTGVAPSTSSPSCAAPRRAVRGGDAWGRRRTTLYRRGFEESVPTRFQCGFPGTAWTTTARAPPSERGALGWSKACATWCATPPFSVAHEYDATSLTPGGGNRRSIPLRPRPSFPAPLGRSYPRQGRGRHGIRRWFSRGGRSFCRSPFWFHFLESVTVAHTSDKIPEAYEIPGATGRPPLSKRSTGQLCASFSRRSG